MKSDKSEEIAALVIESFGGREELKKYSDSLFDEVNTVWNQDHEAMGRILRAHLYVEYFLNEFLVHNFPTLKFNEVRLSFSQKLDLISDYSPFIKQLIPSLRKLNSIRNRMAHSYHVEITKDDMNALRNGMFGEMLMAMKKALKDEPKNDLDFIEEFAKYVGVWLQGVGKGRPLVESITNASNKVLKENKT